MKMKKILFILPLIFISLNIIAQNDTLVMTDNTVLTGEIKKMENGVLAIETDFSDDDFKVEWKKVKSLKSTTFFLISLSSGVRVNGTISTTTGGGVELIPLDSSKSVVKTTLSDIVFLNPVDKGFWDRVSASVDVGFDLAKANNMRQISSRMGLGYIAPRWGSNVNFSSLFSKQDGIDNIKRYDGGLGYKYFLKKHWYIPISVNFLSNTEQSIKFRTVGKAGAGYNLIQSNTLYWGLETGFAFNNELYFTDDPSRNSGEAFLGTEFNVFDADDFSILAKTTLYYDLTEKNHLRSDVSIDFKYDLPLDFYVVLSYSLNFDNKPVQDASKTDYVFHTGFGWSW